MYRLSHPKGIISVSRTWSRFGISSLIRRECDGAALRKSQQAGFGGGVCVLYNADMVKFTALLSQQIGKTVAPSFNKSRIYDTPAALSCLPPLLLLCPPSSPCCARKGDNY